MKKVLVLLVLVGAGLGVWWFLGRGGGVAPPVGKVLPEAHRPGVTGVQHLDVLGTRALPLLAVMGDQLPIPPEALADPAKRIEALGFDPASAEGWASIGIDAAAGVALTADDRVHAGPSLQGIALLKVLDQGKLLAFIEKRSGVKPTVEAGEPISTLVFGEARMMFGRRGDWTAVLLVPPDEQAALREGFGAFLSDTSPTLAGTRPWREAFRDADDSPQFFAWTGAVAAGAAAAALGLPAEATSTIDFYARFLPAVAAHIGPKHSHLRVLASEDGITLLRQLFAPRKRPPVFSRFLPEKGWGAVRLSINLVDVFDGLIASMPPAAAQARGQLGMGQMLLTLATGVTWNELAAAISGHFVVAGDAATLKGGGGLDVLADSPALALIAVQDEAAADALLKTITDKLAAKAKGKGATVEAMTLDGHAGWRLGFGPVQVAVVRVDDVILVGVEPQVKAALDRAGGAHLSGTEAIDGDVVLGVHADLSATLASDDPEIVEALNSPELAPLRDNPILRLRVALDGHGLHADGDGAVSPETLFAWIFTRRVSQAAIEAPPMPPDDAQAPPPPTEAAEAAPVADEAPADAPADAPAEGDTPD